MIVRSVSAKGLATYPSLERRFPERGLILIVGDNGAGKSMGGYEAMSWLLHGETMRGSAIAEGKGEIRFGVRGEEYVVTRSRKGRTHKLTLDCGIIEMTGATPTETQKEINKLVGSHARFGATAIFARDLLARFALATDKERKALLEEALGLGQYDRALKGVVAQRQIANGNLAVADAKVPLIGARLAELEQRVGKLSNETMRPAAAVEEELARLGDPPVEPEEDLSSLRAEVEAAEVALRGAEAARRRQMERHKELTRQIGQQHDGCPTCGRAYDAATQAVVVADMEEQLAALGDQGAKAHLQAKVRYESLKEEFEERYRVNITKQRARERHAADRQALEMELRYARSADTQLADARAALEKAKADQLLALVERDEAARRIRLLDAAHATLGVRGARVLQLTRALGRLEQEANLFLGQVHPCLRVQVRGEDDAVVVRVQGAGGGDYKGCSGSQRVLVDVSLMMGLAAMRSGDGILVFDEVFDSLDARYAEAVAAYLQEQARLRQVVVISHHEQARSMFRPVACWRARMDEDGLSYLEDA